MPGINLLPWREWRRRRAVRCWQGALCASLLVGVLVALLGSVWLDRRLEWQSGVNDRLAQRIAGLSGDLEQVALLRELGDELLGQWNELQRLRDKGQSAGDLLLRLMEIVPPGARLDELQLADGELRLSGLARGGEDVAQLLRNLSQAPGLGAPDLQELVSASGGERFRLLVRLQAQESS
ncbi:MAG: PilN domain-containing protein [Paucimonas sp.]|jgi:type IV pilus assembly protein PilN|nr:PilN domain-containing protein [Paucimonas sp.]